MGNNQLNNNMNEDLLDLEKCDCGRSYCYAFNGAEGDWGRSYTLEEVREIYNNIPDNMPKIKKHLEKILNNSSTTTNGK